MFCRKYNYRVEEFNMSLDDYSHYFLQSDKKKFYILYQSTIQQFTFTRDGIDS